MTVRLDISGGLATIAIERSSLNVATKIAFKEAVDSAASDASVRAVLLTSGARTSVSVRISVSMSPHSRPTPKQRWTPSGFTTTR